ncbi:MAG: gluconate 2-dehydrogenase subunit 3 family protein [Acidisphaera sp.]|nr:gluconate 2-dehydrogenase subunit 3 family protein [Acidisphaera sp.]
MAGIARRRLLTTTAWLLCGAASARAMTVKGALPWAPGEADPPQPARPGPWVFFTPEEGADVEALADRLIPPDPDTPGGRDSGCAVFIDRQLAGAYGSYQGYYMRPPFQDGSKEQGMQSPVTPAQRYRAALAALDKHCRAAFAGKPFAQIPDDQKDAIIRGLESSSLQLDGSSGRAFFELLLKDTQHGFLADPIYGGNRDMAGWKMIGFPGARYDYRDWVERHNEPYPRPPMGIEGRPAWTPPRSQ